MVSAWLLAVLPWGAPLPVVVLDPGHGGAHVGAVGTCDVVEKDITLSIARHTHALLEASRKVQPVLTRTVDRHLDLEDRAAIANEARAALLVSIHANAGAKASHRGVEIYYLSPRTADRRTRDLVRRENEGLHVPQPQQRRLLTRILRDLRQRAVQVESQSLARRLLRTLTLHVSEAGRGVLHAPFWVLLEARMPAVLVEVGFLTHPHECQQLRTDRHQRRVALALTAGILEHLDSARQMAWHTKKH